MMLRQAALDSDMLRVDSTCTAGTSLVWVSHNVETAQMHL